MSIRGADGDSQLDRLRQPDDHHRNQGDVIVWENLVFRSWNSPTPAGGSHCGDWPMAQGEEGVHVIDISDPTNPDVIGFVDTPCGSHTETLVPDLESGRLLIYSNSSANTIFGGMAAPDSPPTCRGIDIIEVPLDAPEDASGSWCGARTVTARRP